ncbi:LOW QUALITY PROTEIN: hypothetical protein HID58_029278, partial [Brassica napus]
IYLPSENPISSFRVAGGVSPPPLTPVAPPPSLSSFLSPLLFLLSSVFAVYGASDPDLRRSKVEEWICGSFGQSEWLWFRSGVRSGFLASSVSLLCHLCLIFSTRVRKFAWLKALRSPVAYFLTRSTILAGASMVFLSFPRRFGLLRDLHSGDVYEEVRSRSCQPRLTSLVVPHV